MRHLLAILVSASALTGLPAAAAAQDAPDLRDFSLPPAPSPSASPRVQGPVDTDAPVPVAPRVIATPRAPASPRPALRLPEATPLPASTPRIVPSPVPARSLPQAGSAPAAPRVGDAATERPVSPVLPAPPSILVPNASPSAPTPRNSGPPSLPVPRPSARPPATAEAASALNWLMPGALMLVGLLAGAVWWRRRSGGPRTQTIERPLVTRPGAANDDERPAASADALKIELAAVKLTRSFRNATLAYRITLHNRSARALDQVAVAGELIGAHGSQPLENQIASTGTDLPELHRIERLSLGQSRTLDGTLTLPLDAIVPIRQGSAALFVPLFRLVVTGAGAEPLARTFVVGQPSAGATGRLTPFRLDEPPRSYQPIGQRALD